MLMIVDTTYTYKNGDWGMVKYGKHDILEKPH